MSNIAGKAYAMNVITPLKPMQTWVTRVIHWLAGTKLFSSKLRGLITLSLIHYAGWAIIARKHFPVLHADQPREKLTYSYYLFFSNFNGSWEQYVDSFSTAIPSGLDLMWYKNIGYPKSVPRTPFHEYILHNQIWTDHYYSAYPLAASNDVKAACRLKPRIVALAEQAQTATPEQFTALYEQMLAECQEDLGLVAETPIVSLANQAVLERRRLERQWRRQGRNSVEGAYHHV